jgi:hypothetical protein
MACVVPNVVWSFRAQRRLKDVLQARRAATSDRIDPAGETERLDRVLMAAFPSAATVIVQEQFVGFRTRDREFILQVEVHQVEQPGHYVVKVNDPLSLAAELDAWDSCRPDDLRGDPLLMMLDAVRGDDGKLLALRYQDAQQFIGVDRIVSLEAAFLQSVQSGTPTPESVAYVMTELFARLGHQFYRGCRVVAPSGDDVVLNGQRSMQRYLERWEQPQAQVNARRIAIAALSATQDGFVDPITFMQFVLKHLQSGRPAADYVPRMLRGPAHGDLHGRNVLVGLVGHQAHWPAVFDYEDMHADNLLGWDFAKLETELKIRAYPLIFGDKTLLDLAARIFSFETSLDEATEDCRRKKRNWPSSSGSSGEERLMNLLLTIRRLAGEHLGADERSTDWLEECYFLLGCYGIYAGKFDNLNEVELVGDFLSAGVAFARFAWSREQRMTAPSAGEKP